MVCYWQGDSVADATGFVRYHMDGRVQRGSVGGADMQDWSSGMLYTKRYSSVTTRILLLGKILISIET